MQGCILAAPHMDFWNYPGFDAEARGNAIGGGAGAMVRTALAVSRGDTEGFPGLPSQLVGAEQPKKEGSGGVNGAVIVS
jgi:hypothetical protein